MLIIFVFEFEKLISIKNVNYSEHMKDFFLLKLGTYIMPVNIDQFN